LAFSARSPLIFSAIDESPCADESRDSREGDKDFRSTNHYLAKATGFFEGVKFFHGASARQFASLSARN
jgi:hypothetical protein